MFIANNNIKQSANVNKYNERINENENASVKLAIKNRQKASIVYCTNRTKRLMEILRKTRNS